jgi:predicted O-linked N-acetylglucosamine transferase (SPINDLY family)
MLLGRPIEALNILEKITVVDKDSVTTLGNIGRCLVACGKVDEAIPVVRKALALDPGNEAVHSGLLLMMNYSSNISAADIYNESLRWGESFGQKTQKVSVPDLVTSGEKRFRIGYVSPDFRGHAVSYFCTSLFKGHDRSKFEITCYSNVANPDDMTERIRNLADNWRDVYGIPDAELARLIKEDRIDILVDLAGHTGGNRLKVFALKPAPIQVTWLGYPGTTGLSAIDYRLTDAIADPEGEADAVHVEDLVRLPQGFLCYAPPAGAPDVVSPPCETNGYVTFGSFNRLEKISPETASAWGEILRRIPRSRLLIKQKSFQEHESREIFLAFLRNSGIPNEQVVAVPYMKSLADHLGMYGSVDMSLDTYPYNGTTTTCESLWMGVPVITLRGNRHASRVGASILSMVGMPELIAGSEADYVELAVLLATDRIRLQSLRSSLRNRVSESPLADSTKFARQVEDAYVRMWHACRNSSPVT